MWLSACGCARVAVPECMWLCLGACGCPSLFSSSSVSRCAFLTLCLSDDPTATSSHVVCSCGRGQWSTACSCGPSWHFKAGECSFAVFHVLDKDASAARPIPDFVCVRCLTVCLTLAGCVLYCVFPAYLSFYSHLSLTAVCLSLCVSLTVWNSRQRFILLIL